jgi:hypothetical protein
VGEGNEYINGIQHGENRESDEALMLGDMFLKSVVAVFDIGGGR